MKRAAIVKAACRKKAIELSKGQLLGIILVYTQVIKDREKNN